MKHWIILLVFITVTSLCKAECQYILDGDLNRDCKVNFTDFSIMAANWLKDCTSNPLGIDCPCDIPWIAEPPMNIARDQFAGGVIDGKIYVFGGNGNPDGMNLRSTEVYDTNTQQWTMLADNNHNNGGWGVEELTSAVVNEKLYVFGAYGGMAPDGYYGVFNFNEMYDPAANTWTTLAQKPTTVAGTPSTVYNNEIYLFGGYFDSDNPSQDHVEYSIVECYNPETNSWRYVTDMPKVLTNFGIATIGQKAYIFGGFSPEDQDILDKVITYDFETGIWNTMEYQPMPDCLAFMYSVSAPVIDGKVYLVGGAKVNLDEMKLVYDTTTYIYDPATDSWQKGSSMPLPLDNHITLSLGEKIYVLGGCNNPDFVNRSKAEVISYDTEFCNP